MFFSKIFGPFPELAGRLAAIALVCGVSAGEAFAGTWTQPVDAIDQFHSTGIHTLVITGLGPNPVTSAFVGYGPTTVVRDNLNEALPQDGKDTINTEITDFHLIGNAGPFYGETVAGAGKHLLPGGLGLDNTRGQIQDDPTLPPGVPPSPVDNIIQLPAKSIFDVFFDVWVDFGDGAGGAPDGIAQVGEVFSNDVRDANGDVDPLSYALRMLRDPLEHVPPASSDVYVAVGMVLAFEAGASDNRNPELGTFQAAVVALPLDLYPILPDRQRFTGSPIQVQLIRATHIPVPEIDAAAGTGAVSLLAGALALVGERRRRKAA